MSRQYQAGDPPLVEHMDDLVSQVYGTRSYQARPPVRGCSGRCCAPGAMSAEGKIGSVVWRWIGSEVVVVVAVVSLIAVAGRGRVW